MLLVFFYMEIAAAGRKAESDLADRQNDAAIFRFNRFADDRIHVHHGLDVLHRGLHQTLNGMLRHIVPSTCSS
ncbi:hypothetical protein D3C76_1504480 [compost metagenome]